MVLPRTQKHTGAMKHSVCESVRACVFVFPAIVGRRLIPPLATDRQLSKFPELIIKSNNSISHTLSACMCVCLLVSAVRYMSLYKYAVNTNIWNTLIQILT